MWEDMGDHLTVKYRDTLAVWAAVDIHLWRAENRWWVLRPSPTEGAFRCYVLGLDNRRGQSTPDIRIPNIIRITTE